MSTQQDLLDLIDANLGAAAISSYTTANAVNDLFEGYVWSMVVTAAGEEGATINYEDVFESPVSTLTFRTSPGNIYSTTPVYTHAVISFPGPFGTFPGPLELEAHVGIFVTGRSQVNHECDVAILDRLEAKICRAHQVHPRVSKVRIAVECKFHAATLKLGYGRGFLGLTEDLGKENRFLVSNVRSSNIERLVTYHKTEWDMGIDLIDTDASANLRAQLSRAFKKMKAVARK